MCGIAMHVKDHQAGRAVPTESTAMQVGLASHCCKAVPRSRQVAEKSLHSSEYKPSAFLYGSPT